MRRRSFIQGVAASLALSSSAAARRSQARGDASGPPRPVPGGEVLLVFFSRAGENYFNGGRKDLTVGNTEVVAGMVRDALRCDVFQIKAVDPYTSREILAVLDRCCHDFTFPMLNNGYVPRSVAMLVSGRACRGRRAKNTLRTIRSSGGPAWLSGSRVRQRRSPPSRAW